MDKLSFFVPGDIFKDSSFQAEMDQRLEPFFENQLLPEFWKGTLADRNPELHMKMFAIIGEKDSFSIPIDDHDDFTIPNVSPWGQVLAQYKAKIREALPACGRLETVEGFQQSYGSAWLVRPDVLVTNSHVAYQFCDPLTKPWNLSRRVKVDFSHDPNRASNLKNYELTKVLHIEVPNDLKKPNPKPDLALFRVNPMNNFIGQIPTPIDLASNNEKPKHVAVIGFPFPRNHCNSWDTVNRIFGGKFNRKNLQPGLVVKNDWPDVDITECCPDADGMQKLVAAVSSLAHTCPTVSGNSGSVVLDIETGKAVGLHFGGCIGLANFAVPARQIRAKLVELNLIA